MSILANFITWASDRNMQIAVLYSPALRLTRRGTYVFISRRGTSLQICKVGDYGRSNEPISEIQTDSYSKSNSLSIEIFIF